MDFVVKSPDLGELAARSRKDGVEGTFVHYTVTKESKSFGLRLQISAETSEAAVQVQGAPHALLEKAYTSPTKKQQILLHHLFSSLFIM